MAKRADDPDELVKIITKGQLTRAEIIEYAELTMGKEFVGSISALDFSKEDPIEIMKLLLKNFLKIANEIIEIDAMVSRGEKYHLIKAEIDKITLRFKRASYIYTGVIHTNVTNAKIPALDMMESMIDANAEIVYSAYFDIKYQAQDTLLLRACNYARLIHGKGDEKYAVELFHRIIRIRNLVTTISNNLKHTQKRALAALAALAAQ